jgi:hypothetical protein
MLKTKERRTLTRTLVGGRSRSGTKPARSSTKALLARERLRSLNSFVSRTPASNKAAGVA